MRPLHRWRQKRRSKRVIMLLKESQQKLVKLPAWRRRTLLVGLLLGFAALSMRGLYL